jgi:polar amino acid transport system permease protein
MVLAMLVGTLVGIGRLSHSRLVRGVCIPFIEFFRNTPLLMQLFFWYFGTSTLLDALASLSGWLLAWWPAASGLVSGGILALKEAYNKGQSEFISGVIGLTVYTAAFIAETVRAGIQAIPHGQTEAARASGLTTPQTLGHVILPQAFRVIIPPLISQFLALTKNSAQAMAIGVAEVTYMARQVEANTFKGFEAFTVATGLYMVIYDTSISIPAMAARRQRMLALRAVPVGYALGWIFVAVAAAGGVFALWQGWRTAAGGSLLAAAGLGATALSALAAALAAARRAEGGLGLIRTGLVVGATAVFFDLLRRLERGLTAFDDVALRESLTAAQVLEGRILLPLGLGTVFFLATAYWWLYFNRREVVFTRGGRR